MALLTHDFIPALAAVAELASASQPSPALFSIEYYSPDPEPDINRATSVLAQQADDP